MFLLYDLLTTFDQEVRLCVVRAQVHLLITVILRCSGGANLGVRSPSIAFLPEAACYLTFAQKLCEYAPQVPVLHLAIRRHHNTTVSTRRMVPVFGGRTRLARVRSHPSPVVHPASCLVLAILHDAQLPSTVSLPPTYFRFCVYLVCSAGSPSHSECSCYEYLMMDTMYVRPPALLSLNSRLYQLSVDPSPERRVGLDAPGGRAVWKVPERYS